MIAQTEISQCVDRIMKAKALAVQDIDDAVNLDIVKYSTVESFMQKVFRPEANAANVSVLQDGIHPRSTVPDDTGSLIESASKAIEFLSSRCEILDQELAQEKAAGLEHIEAMNNWRAIALELKAKVTAIENDSKVITARYHTAEARVLELEHIQTEMTLRADQAEGMSNKLQRQVEAAFGQGSRVRAAMDAAIKQQDVA